jgi:hypothetical protein
MGSDVLRSDSRGGKFSLLLAPAELSRRPVPNRLFSTGRGRRHTRNRKNMAYLVLGVGLEPTTPSSSATLPAVYGQNREQISHIYAKRAL